MVAFISHLLLSLSEHGPGGIDGLASWPQLCGPPLMVAFGPPDDPHAPLSLADNVPALPCHQSHFMSVWRTECVHTVKCGMEKGVLGRIVVLALERSSVVGIDSTIYGFPGRPG